MGKRKNNRGGAVTLAMDFDAPIEEVMAIVDATIAEAAQEADEDYLIEKSAHFPTPKEVHPTGDTQHPADPPDYRRPRTHMIEPGGHYDANATIAMLHFADAVKRKGPEFSSRLRTGDIIDCRKCCRAANLLIGRVASDKPTPTAEDFHTARQVKDFSPLLELPADDRPVEVIRL